MFEPNQQEDLQKLAVPPRIWQTLTVELIREWVDAYRAAHDGSFPSQLSGAIKDREGNDTGENWGAVHQMFRRGAKGSPARGLQNSGYSSLADFLDKTYPTEREPRLEKPDLSEAQIREWVDVYRAAHDGSFPSQLSGAIKDRAGQDTGETWDAVGQLFRKGAKGFPARGLQNSGFESLADFLDKMYPANRKADLTVSQIKDWVEIYRAEHVGRFPSMDSGVIKDRDGQETGEKWNAIDALFRTAAKGRPARGLQRSGFESLPDFLDKTYPTERERKSDLTLLQVQQWVDVYRAAHGGSFPSSESGAITDREGNDTGETWAAVNWLFRSGAKGHPSRGLQNSGYTSLRDFLDKTYVAGRAPRLEKPELSEAQIREWVDVYRAVHDGSFPSQQSGAITDHEGQETGEKWNAINALFSRGAKGRPARGLLRSGFESLADFLDKTYPTERELRLEKPVLSEAQIREWVDAYRAAHGGSFPSTLSGAIKDRNGQETGEKWKAIDELFRAGGKGSPSRGLQNSSYTSLRDFLDKTYPTERGPRLEKSDLSEAQIREWVHVYRAAHDGSFPSQLSGAIKDRDGKDTGETWTAVASLFWNGAKGYPSRGLQNSGYTSLRDFLDQSYPTERKQRTAQKSARPQGDNINPLLDLLG